MEDWDARVEVQTAGESLARATGGAHVAASIHGGGSSGSWQWVATAAAAPKVEVEERRAACGAVEDGVVVRGRRAALQVPPLLVGGWGAAGKIAWEYGRGRGGDACLGGKGGAFRLSRGRMQLSLPR